MTPAQYPADQVPPEALIGAVCVMLSNDQVTVYYRAEDVPPPPPETEHPETGEHPE